MIGKSFILALCILIFSSIPANAEEINHNAHRKIYHNSQYGYTVSVPNLLYGFSNPPPGPNHGIDIPLGRTRHIFVNAEGNTLEYQSELEAIKAIAQYDNSGSVVIRPGKLGRHPATTGSYIGDSGMHKLTEMMMVNEGTLLYSVELVTDKAHEAEDTALFDQVCASFRITKRT